MSAIFGLFDRSGDAVSTETLKVMKERAGDWQPDSSHEWSVGPAAMGQHLLWNTPESRLDKLPRVIGDPSTPLVIVADVRLDNREELVSLLSGKETIAGRVMNTITDSELLLAAYQAWGTESPQKLLGDFAYVIWDATESKLFCVRDHLGVKSLYYALHEEMFFFANDPLVLVGLPDVATELERNALGLYLLDSELFHPELTFWKGIRKLPPATSLEVSAKSVVFSTYWRADDSPSLEFDSPVAAATELRHLLEDAVRVRMRASHSVGSHLSGGLDSSVISAMASRFLRQQGEQLQAYSWIHHPSEEDDSENAEWARGLELAEQEQIVLKNTELTGSEALKLLQTMDLAGHSSVDPWYEQMVRDDAKAAGIRVLLSGWGGDELLSYSGRRVNTDKISHGRLVSALKGILREAGKSKNPLRRILGLLKNEIMIRLPLGRLGPEPSYELLSCADPGFQEYVKTLNSCVYDQTALSVRQEQLGLLAQGHLQNRMESWANAGRRDGVEYRYPLLDKRLVEFALGVPCDFYLQDGIGRYPFRLMASDFLPRSLVWDDVKREPKRINRLVESLEFALPKFLEQLKADVSRLPGLAFVDLDKLEKLAGAMSEGKEKDLEDRIDQINLMLKTILLLGAGRMAKI